MNEHISIWESWLSHPGTKAFLAYVEREWGDSGVKYQAEMERALNLTDNHASASQARQILSGKKVIQALMRWPQEELARLKREEKATDAEPVMSRRGSL